MADISKITLPSGNTYYIKDETARQAISGGVSFIIAWDGASTPVVADIPAGVKVTYNSTEYTGTLAASDAQAGAFYLVASSTSPSGHADVYDEYVPVGTPKTWEKIGDTQVDLSDVVTDVELSKQSATVIGSDATFTITQPSVTIASGSSGDVTVATGITSVSASGDSVTAVTGYSPSSDTFLTGVKITAQPSITLTANGSTGDGRITYVESQGTLSTTKISATTSAGSNDTVAAITAITPTTASAASSVTPTTKKLSVGSVTGVQSTTTTASKATSGTALTGATGTWTAVSASETDADSDGNPDANENLLANVAVTNETLIIGAATLDTQSIPQYTFSNVTVPIKDTSATAVATGATTTTGDGADIVTDVAVGNTVTVLTGLGTPTTDNVLGEATTFSSTIASGSSGDVTVGTSLGAGTTKYLSAGASGTTVGADGTGTALTALGTPSTDTVLGTSSTITVTPTTTKLSASASGGSTAWNNKDQKTVLDSSTVLVVDKGFVEVSE